MSLNLILPPDMARASRAIQQETGATAGDHPHRHTPRNPSRNRRVSQGATPPRPQSLPGND
jgi:hypothetical protein